MRMQSYREMIFEGDLTRVRAFLLGLKAGRGWSAEPLFAEHCGIQRESQGRRILEALRLEKDLTYVLVPERYAQSVARAVRQAGAALEIKVQSDRAIKEGRLRYRFRTHGKAAAARIHRALSSLTGELVRVAEQEQKEEHPDAQGLELYAPEHEFTDQGAGSIHGPIDQLVALRGKLERVEGLVVDEIQVILG
jgi:hypothetical protein